jgi:hypothetical protein
MNVKGSTERTVFAAESAVIPVKGAGSIVLEFRNMHVLYSRPSPNAQQTHTTNPLLFCLERRTAFSRRRRSWGSGCAPLPG